MSDADGTGSGAFEARLNELGLDLPNVPTPVANFVPYRVHGDLVVLAGQVCEWNGTVRYSGKVGVEVGLEAAQDAARICALNLIAALREACAGNLDRVAACLRLGGFVNCALDYTEVPKVINGASDLMHDLFGAHGAHARTAVGVAALPQGASVEVDAMFVLKAAM